MPPSETKRIGFADRADPVQPVATFDMAFDAWPRAGAISRAR
jgi:hypothetical protein